jgi:TusA-related sulfurtransferase
MPDEVILDCIGMRCPRPIIEIAKYVRRCEPGSVFIVQADDLAFESDVRAWAETTQNKLLEIEKQDRIFRARIQAVG